MGILTANRSEGNRGLAPILRIGAFVLVSIAAACSSSKTLPEDADIPMVKDALRPETVIGPDVPREDFLLAKPTGLAVTDSGDIIVTDENFVKVFDAAGRPKILRGGKGRGPGQFEGARIPFLGPSGYLAVIDTLFECNTYDPDLNFVAKENILGKPELRIFSKQEDLSFRYFRSVCPLDSERKIICLFGQNLRAEGRYPVFYYLLYTHQGELSRLTEHRSKSNIKNKPAESGSSGNELLGGFHWDLLNEREIVFSATWDDRQNDGKAQFYALHVMDIETKRERKIIIPFEPLPMSPYLRELKPFYLKAQNRTLEPNADLAALLSRQEQFPTMKALRTDGDHIFIFKFNLVNEERDKKIMIAARAGEAVGDEISGRGEPYEADVISASRGRLISRARFPFIPDVIKNGRAYKIQTVGGFPAVVSGRIEAAVYGLPPRTGR